jgi:hydroxyacylglutathione hydrolase
MAFQIEKFVTGPIETNTYLIVNDEKKCILIDPSMGCEEILQHFKINGYIPEAIVITHGHFDHVIGIDEIKGSYPDLDVFINPGEAVLLKNPAMNGSSMIGYEYKYTGVIKDLIEGDMTIGSVDLKVIVVPGHSPAGTAVLIGKYLICGDILFAGSVGRSDLMGGDGDLLIKGIREKLLILPDETVVCPGHGGRTTIARERRENPFL